MLFYFWTKTEYFSAPALEISSYNYFQCFIKNKMLMSWPRVFRTIWENPVNNSGLFFIKRKVMILTCMEVCWEYLCRLQQPSVKDDYSFETSPLIWEPNINLIFSYFNINILYHFISSPSMCKFWAKYLLIYLKFQTRIIWQIHTLNFEN